MLYENGKITIPGSLLSDGDTVYIEAAGVAVIPADEDSSNEETQLPDDEDNSIESQQPTDAPTEDDSPAEE